MEKKPLKASIRSIGATSNRNFIVLLQSRQPNRLLFPAAINSPLEHRPLPWQPRKQVHSPDGSYQLNSTLSSTLFSASLFYFLPNYNLLKISGSSGSNLLTNLLWIFNTTTTPPEPRLTRRILPSNTIPAGYSPIYYLGIFLKIK